MNVLEERGYFWWDDEPIPDGQFAPNAVVTGLLKIADEGIAHLELDGNLPSEHVHPLQRHFDFNFPGGKRIRGILKGANIYALLCELSRSGSHVQTNGVSYERYRARKCLIGDRSVTAGTTIDQFKRMKIELKGFEQWLWLNSIAVTRTEDEFSAQYRKPDDLTFRLDEEILELKYDLDGLSSQSVTDTLNLREVVFLVYTTKEYFSLDAVAELHSQFTQLLLMLAGSHYNLDWPILSQDGGDACKFYFWREISGSEPPGFRDWWVDFHRIKESFGSLFANWRLKRNEFAAGFSSYLATRRSVRLYVEHRFMSLIWGIESFHRTKYGDSLPKLEEKIARILNCITLPKDAKWLAGILKHKQEPPLEKRIVDVFTVLDIGIDEKSLKLFATRCAKLRNDISHFGGQRHRDGKYQEFLLELYQKSNALAYLYHALLLKEIGIDDNNLRTAVHGGTQSFKFKTHLAEAGVTLTASKDGP
jgi:hypothetical protein